MIIAAEKKKSTETVCLPVYREMHPIGIRNFIMKQDNDPKHTTNITKDFKSMKPSQSPKLNTTKHAFHFVKRRKKNKKKNR